MAAITGSCVTGRQSPKRKKILFSFDTISKLKTTLYTYRVQTYIQQCIYKCIIDKSIVYTKSISFYTVKLIKY